MRITNFQVSFKRSKQPANYETAEPQVSINGTLDDDEKDPEGRIREAMLTTVRVVYNTLAMDVPPGIVEKLTDVDPSDTNAPVETPVKRGPGRPRGSTKKQVEAPVEEPAPPSADRNAREADAKAKTRYFVHPESDSLFTTEDGSRPVGDGMVEEISAEQYASLQARKSAEAEPITDAKLMSFVTKVSGKLGAKAVKAKLAEMEVARVGEMDQDQRRKFIADLEAAMEGDKA